MTKKIKKEIKKMPKRLMVFTIIVAMLFSYFAPITNVFALDKNVTLSVTFRDDSANYGKVEYSLDDGAHWDEITSDEEKALVVSGDNLRLKLVPNEGCIVDYAGIEMRQDDNDIGGLSSIGFENDNGYSVPSNVQVVQLSRVEFKSDEHNSPNPDNPSGDPSLNTFSNVNIHIEGEELEYDNPWSSDATDFIFGINNSPEMRRLAKNEVSYIIENNEIVGLDTINPINYQYDYNNEGTVTFHIRTQIDDLITSLKINDVLYNTPQTKEALANAFSEWSIAFDVLNVPYSETYNIEVIGRKQTEEEKVVGNFAWTYDENSNEYSEDDKILHGTLEFVKAEYDNVTYTTIEQVNNAGEMFAWEDGVRGTDNPTGEALFPTGTVLTLRLIPDAGYQLTSFDLNGMPFEPGEEVGLYTFTIGGGNWHLGAHFTEVNNEVQANSQNVKSGSIDINAGFENGTAKLEVNDVSSMSPERRDGFENKANEDNYGLEYYLDISLYNSIYKGGKKDSNGNYESWDTPVENIENDATITLALEDEMDGKDIAIVHETHNGDEITGYELIDAVYNEENNTITFKTDGFSNYAIVSKENPDSTKYTVHFDSRGGSMVDDKQVISGNSVAEPTAPTKEGWTFDGWFEDSTLSARFDFNTPITDNVTLYANWIESNNQETKKYTIEDNNGNSITFTNEKDREFTFSIINYLSFTDEQLEEAGIPKEMYNQIMDAISNATKKYGTLLAFYEIEVINDDDYQVHESPSKFNIKIKMTDEMKKYNTFKIIYLDMDDEGNINPETPIELKVEGDYLIGTLEHLSNYALTGSISTTPNKAKNPKTSDNIYFWTKTLAISVLGLSFGVFATKRIKKKVK